MAIRPGSRISVCVVLTIRNELRTWIFRRFSAKKPLAFSGLLTLEAVSRSPCFRPVAIVVRHPTCAIPTAICAGPCFSITAATDPLHDMFFCSPESFEICDSNSQMYDSVLQVRQHLLPAKCPIIVWLGPAFGHRSLLQVQAPDGRLRRKRFS